MEAVRDPAIVVAALDPVNAALGRHEQAGGDLTPDQLDLRRAPLVHL